MIRLGEIQSLILDKLTPQGAYLKEKDFSDESVLLPRAQVPNRIELGHEIEVFIYNDSSDRMIATTKKPLLTLGKTAELKVAQVTDIGAFLDWGLEKDLLLPFKEQTCPVQEEKTYLVGLYIDKSDRLCATMDVYKMLASESPYEINDTVSGTLYLIKEELGAFVAVDNQYHGLIPDKEFYGQNRCGDHVEARVVYVREDGKLELSLRDKAYIQMDKDTETILERLTQSEGVLFLNDKSDPNKISEELKMSKRAYKRVVGRLLKEGKIKITETGIELIK